MFSCSQSSNQGTLNHFETIKASTVEFNSSRGVFYVNGKKFSGSIYWTYQNGKDTVRVKRYLEGKKSGEWRRYYQNGSIAESRFFLNGKKEGTQIAYYRNGNLKFQANFVNDVYEGNSKAWTFDGRLIKDQNYHLGKEEGSQKVWYDNGKIKANYVIKEGRRYGLLGTKNCINVSDETF